MPMSNNDSQNFNKFRCLKIMKKEEKIQLIKEL
jgi:hypothetical protein